MMTEAVQIAMIAATPPTLVAIGAIIISWRNGKKTDALAITVDGRLSQLLDLTATAAEAKGVLKQQAQEITTHALINSKTKE